MAFSSFIVSVLQVAAIALLQGGITSIIAVGFALMLGVQKIFNIAYGDTMILGSYVAFALIPVFPYGWMVAPIAVTAAVGFVVYRYLIRVGQRHQVVFDVPVLITIGVSFVLENSMSVAWTTNTQFVSTSLSSYDWILGGVILPVQEFLSAVIAIATGAGVWLILYRTKFGKEVRASAQDPEAAQTVGIDTKRIGELTFTLSSGISGIAAVLIAVNFAFTPVVGLQYTLIGLTAVILGGQSDIRGAIVGSLLIYLIGAMFAFFIGTGFQLFAEYMAFIVVVIVRPTGLFSRPAL